MATLHRSLWFTPLATAFWLIAPLILPLPAQIGPREHTRERAAISVSDNSKADGQRRATSRRRQPTLDLKTMARQLLVNPTPSAYAKVEAYAGRHPDSNAAGLAWLVIGYAHLLGREYPRAIAALKQARPQAGLLTDYATYFLATCYAGIGDDASVVETLHNFEKDYPHSLFLNDANIILANASLAQGQPQVSIALLERHRRPVRADVELALGRAYITTGATAKAVEILRGVYFEMPMTPAAEEAGRVLASLPQASASAPSFELRKRRADLFLQARAYSDAANEYQALLPVVSNIDTIDVQLSLVSSLRHLHRYGEAERLLESMNDLTGEFRAQELYERLAISCAKSDEGQVQKLIPELRKAATNRTWLERGLLSVATMYLREEDYKMALSFYRELGPVPENTPAHYGHWRATWLSVRHNRGESKGDLEDQIMLYPGSPEVAAALYWLARLAEEEQDLPKAHAYYQKIIERFSSSYYAELSRRELNDVRGTAAPTPIPVIDRILPPRTRVASSDTQAPPRDPRVQKAQVLQDAGLTKFAVEELQVVGADSGSSDWVIGKVVDYYQDAGRYDLAMDTVKRSAPEYLNLEITDLPQRYWQALFPRAFWNDVKQCSRLYGLDPFLVAGVIRQESEFNPNAVSGAKALGLMQILPSTGKTLAHQLGIPLRSRTQLFPPKVNVKLGTFLLRKLLDEYGSQLEFALAAYNAGRARVQEWRSEDDIADMPEFVESIPFVETRYYVQAVLRNASVYRRLYGEP